MTTQPELPEVAPAPAPVRPVLRLAPPAQDVDFEGFVRSYEARLRRLVMRRIGDLCEAEEITQETLLRAYQHRASFSTEDELMAWSTVVAQRLVIDRVRVRGRSVAVADVPETARLGRDTADIVVARHEARAALESLEAIPTRQAAILWAREVEGLHYEEIAERFGISEPAVRSLLHRGRKALRKEFKDRTGSLPLNGLVPFAPWLLALKAAGKVRGAAKTVAKAPAGAVAALSLTALVASVGIGGSFRPAPYGDGVAVRPVDGTSVHVTTAAPDRPDGATRLATYRLAGPATSPAGTVHQGKPPNNPTIPLPTICQGTTATRGVCFSQDGEHVGAVIVIPLPENSPLDAKELVVSQDQVGCDTLRIPTNDAVRCEQRDGSTSSESRAPLPSRTITRPSTEGAVR